MVNEKHQELEEYKHEVKNFFEELTGERINHIDLYSFPVLMNKRWLCKTDGVVRVQGDEILIDQYTVILISLTPHLPFYDEDSIYDVIVTTGFELHKEYIKTVLEMWFSEKSDCPMDVETLIKVRIDEELENLTKAITIEDDSLLYTTKNTLERLVKTLNITEGNET